MRKTSRNITVEKLRSVALREQEIEIVERKGIGHPDSICDAVMEALSVALAQEYRSRFGFIPHFNVDKGLLAAGAAEHRLGGGQLLAPMRLIFGDRATFEVGGQHVPVEEIAVQVAQEWFRANLPLVQVSKDVVYQVEIRPGAPELASILQPQSGPLRANDTSAAVGYAPLTPTEQLVFETERFLNSKQFKQNFPETGQDVKVMGFRVAGQLNLTVAMPLLDRYISSEAQYFQRKQEIVRALRTDLDQKRGSLQTIQVELNTLDSPGKGLEGMYLSVLGTSAEDGDSGEVGRGNRINGLISLRRPASAEAAPGKNPVSHVGKIYNVLADHLARRIYSEVPGLQEVYVWLCSQIGRPIDQPSIAAAQVVPELGMHWARVERHARDVIDAELSNIQSFTEELILGERSVF